MTKFISMNTIMILGGIQRLDSIIYPVEIWANNILINQELNSEIKEDSMIQRVKNYNYLNVT